MKTAQKGIAKSEFLVLIILVFLVSAICSACMANIYFTKEDVLKDLGNGCPGVKSIVKVERNYFAKSLITVETYYGIQIVYELDTNILFQYSYSFKAGSSHR